MVIVTYTDMGSIYLSLLQSKEVACNNESESEHPEVLEIDIEILGDMLFPCPRKKKNKKTLNR